MASKHIFITGANGYLGSIITEFAIDSGYKVVGLSRTSSSDDRLHALGASAVRGDLTTYEILEQESARADIVIHLADSLSNDYSQDYNQVVKTDGLAIDAIVQGLAGTNKHLIVTSGTLVASPLFSGDETNETSPLHAYPLNDRIKSETYALSQATKGIQITAIRLAPFVYGRGGSGVKLLMSMAASAGEAVYIGDGKTRTSTVHVEDAAQLYLLAAERGKAGIYNATSETDITFKQLMTALGKVLDLPVVSKPLDEMIAKAGPFLAGFLSAENRASSAKAIDELGWKTQGSGILEDIERGSYVQVAKEMK